MNQPLPDSPVVNDYDRTAADRQKALQSGKSMPHRFVEKPAMKKLIPNLTGKKVLMLGCGTGEESLLLEEFGAADMLGIDLSVESVRLANETYPAHKFIAGDIHTLPFDDTSFDFVYSSLTIHYSETPLQVYQEIMRVLKPDGKLQFSVGHPLRWASERTTIDGRTAKLMGYTEGDEPVRRYGSYMDFDLYKETFMSGETLQFWVGPPSMHFALLREVGFNVTAFVETRAIEEAKDVELNYFDRFNHFPQFTIFSAEKPS